MTTESNLVDKRLPNGQVVTNLAPSATASDIMEKAVEQGLATEDQFYQWKPEMAPFSYNAKQWTVENLDLIGGTVGGIATPMVAGFMGAGPVGAIGVGIVGGALGSGSGSLATDYLKGEELNTYKALKETVASAGIDLALLGTGKLAKPIANWIIRGKGMGKSVEQQAQELLTAAAQGGDVGSKESIKATQAFLEKHGATLTPYQTGQHTLWQGLSQSFAEVGMFSQGTMKANRESVDTAVNGAFERIINKAPNGMGLESKGVGEALFGVIDAGRQQLQTEYGKGLTTLMTKHGAKAAPLSGLRQTLINHVAQHQSKHGVHLNDDTLKVINNFFGSVGNFQGTTTKDLLRLEKSFLEGIKPLMTKGSNVYNDVASRELAQVSTLIRESIDNTLKKIDPELGTAYSALNKGYSESLQTLLPKMTTGSMANANKGDFEALGKIMTNTTASGLGRVQAVLGSIDESFRLLKRGGHEGVQVGNIFIRNAEEAKEAVRAGFLQTLMPNAGKAGFSAQEYASLATKWQAPDFAKRLSLVMGKDAKSAKQLLNTMAEATATRKGNIGELMMKAKEWAAVSSSVQAGSAVLMGSSLNAGGLLAGASVLVAPMFLAKAATNPKNVNRIVAFGKAKFKTERAMMLAAGNLVSDVLLDATEEERQEIMTNALNSFFGVK